MAHLEIKKMYEDFNFVMPEKRWVHFEFESDDIMMDELIRFREYEAVISLKKNGADDLYRRCERLRDREYCLT